MTLKNSKTLLTVSLTLLLCSMFGATFLYRALEKLAEESGEAKDRLLTFDSQLKDFKIFESFIANTENERKLVEESFVGREGLIKFIENIERVGGEGGVDVRVESANLAPGQKNSWPSFRLETSGKFSSVFRFPLLLENLPYEISFEEINITKSGDLKEPWNAVYAIKLLSYEF
ncbi:hypothetical protein A2W48_00930 [Candidatus Giovannonibacteria bacterium RIFCSPHIGHO2_12_44_12]|uniref:Uncharacterized protein n=1 Tax=Candidatus Giovannonibacteria bacterium RIFCSPHIGHO2_12_44_12 TaxID=1798340 RepID=A0A1F5WXY2_9BACT|nr:MAG: hypothetical protein A2W48_00930 [Candidatus Giovannonibacteria bacterium RIFCSPHIGHO2_12_44_12]